MTMRTTGPDPDLLRRGRLRYEVDDRVATVTLSRPDIRNAQVPTTWEALTAVGACLPSSVRVVVVCGEGEAFSAGLDRGMLTTEGVAGETPFTRLLEQGEETMAAAIARYQEGFTWLRRDDLVSVAAVQGPAVGAGFQLALACDLRVCADDVRFAMREPSLGLVPDLTGTKPLVELVGYARALELCATGRWVGAEESHGLGLATAVVARAELDATVADLVAALLEADHGAVTETKALLRGAAGLDLDRQRRAEREAQVRRFRALAAARGG